MKIKKCRYKTVYDIKKHYGYDWSNLNLNGAEFRCQDLTNVILSHGKLIHL